MVALEVPHLIGLPYTQANCAQVVRMALAEFVSPAAAAALPVTPQEGAQALPAIYEGQTSWQAVGAASASLEAPGRVVFLRSCEEGPGVGITLGDGFILTSSPGRGSYSVRGRSLRSQIQEVYEWKA